MKKFALFICLTLTLTLVTNAQPGTNDHSFNMNGAGADSTVYSTTIQNNGKIIIGGQFTAYNGIAINRIARLDMDGNLDTSFDVGTGANNTVYATAQQSDGKIIIAGDFISFNGKAINRMARLNTNGSLDTTFNVGTGAKHCIYATAIQNDGKIIFVGDFDTINGTARYRLVRMNPNGSVDMTFDPGLGATCTVYALVIQNDGKIIIGGAFVNYDGTPINRIARLNTNGSLDNTFDPGIGANGNVYSTTLQSDGKILIGGLFSDYNGIAINHVARLNSNGILDTSFHVGSAANSVVFSSSVQTDGQVIIGGGFTNYNGITTNGLARLDANGSRDATFNNGTGTNYNIISTAIQADGKIIIAGAFTTYNDKVRNRIARIIGGNEVMTIVKENTSPENLNIYPNPNTGTFFIQTNSEAAFSIVNELGQLVQSVNLNANNNFRLSFSDFRPGMYFIYGVNNHLFQKQKIFILR